VLYGYTVHVHPRGPRHTRTRVLLVLLVLSRYYKASEAGWKHSHIGKIIAGGERNGEKVKRASRYTPASSRLLRARAALICCAAAALARVLLRLAACAARWLPLRAINAHHAGYSLRRQRTGL